MIERFTADQLAIAIEEQVEVARPRPKLLRRFFVSGKRDGKRGRDSDPMRIYLSEGVSIASSRIAERYIATRAEKTKQRDGLHLRIDEHPAQKDVEEPNADTETKQANADSPPAPSPDVETEVQELPSDEDLHAALGALADARSAREVAKRAAEAEQRHTELIALREQLAVLDSEIESLADQFRQLVESCHSVGRFLWARYCNGYAHGKARSRVEGGAETPDPTIRFEVPDVLYAQPATRPLVAVATSPDDK
jgi:hypothetical protein